MAAMLSKKKQIDIACYQIINDIIAVIKYFYQTI